MPSNPRHKNEHGALTDAAKRSEKIDIFFKESLKSLPSGESCTLVAIGGYGRREMAPHSDTDLLVLSDSAPSPALRKWAEPMNRHFWSAQGKLAFSLRSIGDCGEAMENDIHFLTSLIDMRFVAGDRALYKKLHASFARHVRETSPARLITAKLEEQQARHRKMGDSRYQLQPNVKEGKGALRDIHTLLWLAGLLFDIHAPQGLVHQHILTADEAATLQKAHAFFNDVRRHLHDITGRDENRLSFEFQPVVAERMGYTDPAPHIRAERFMRDYFLMTAETGHLTRILCADLEARALAAGSTAGTRTLALRNEINGFAVENNRLTVEDDESFCRAPHRMVDIFRTGQLSRLDIHPDALRHMRRCLAATPAILRGDEKAMALFTEILLDSRKAEQTLRRMNEAGLLTALIPDFANIQAHMQYDMYHVFTADEHTIRAVGLMHALENGDLAEAAPLSTALFPKIKSRRALFAAMFLHDIAKGTGGGHSEKGAEAARRLCPQMGLTAEECETTAWLVEHHLLMTMTAFKRDLGDAQTIADFAGAVQSPERLKLLTILTVADIMAVGPDRWNNWKAGLLRELYHKAQAILTGAEEGYSDEDATILQQKKARRLAGASKKAFTLLADHAPKSFWLNFTPQALADIARILNGVAHKSAPTLVHLSADAKSDFTEVVIYTPDQRGLFALLSGAMAASGASIVDARIFTLGNGMALDIFRIQNHKGRVYDNTPFLQKRIERALAHKLDLAEELRDRQKSQRKDQQLFPVTPRIIIDNKASAHATLIEVNGKDRIGFLHDITSKLTEAGLQIMAAKITTFGSRAVDVFYVKDNFGLKILHPQKLLSIENSLKNALEGTP